MIDPEFSEIARDLDQAKHHATELALALERVSNGRPAAADASALATISQSFLVTLLDATWWESTLPIWIAAARQSLAISERATQDSAN